MERKSTHSDSDGAVITAAPTGLSYPIGSGLERIKENEVLSNVQHSSIVIPPKTPTEHKVKTLYLTPHPCPHPITDPSYPITEPSHLILPASTNPFYPIPLAPLSPHSCPISPPPLTVEETLFWKGDSPMGKSFNSLMVVFDLVNISMESHKHAAIRTY